MSKTAAQGKKRKEKDLSLTSPHCDGHSLRRLMHGLIAVHWSPRLGLGAINLSVL